MNRIKIIEIAKKEIGISEDPANTNKTKYGEWYEMNGVAWCAIFVSWVFDQAGLPLAEIQTKKGYHHCQGAHNYFRNNNRLTTNPLKGDIVMFDWNGNNSANHTGIFVKWINADKTEFLCLEGNTAIGDNSNGGIVMERNRKINNVKSFASPKVYEQAIQTPSSVIKIGDRGSKIAQVQKMLDDLGYTTIADGWFGVNSAASVKAFQEDNLMKITGEVDDVTFGALQEEIYRKKIAKKKLTTGTYISYNDSGYWVTELQRALNKNGANPKIKIDGQFGRNTKKQLLLFQERKNLIVDGVAGPQTFIALNMI